MLKPLAVAVALLPVLLVGCRSNGLITDEGITVTRSACPAVAIPAETGDITLFDPPASRDAGAIDVVASLTNVRATCDDTGEYVNSQVTFDVFASRRDAGAARNVVVPYFATVVQGGTNVVSKRLGNVTLHFDAGQTRASSTGSATGEILRSAATLPAEVTDRLTRKRKPGDADAALDPMADPSVRTAVQRASFELLVGFQLTTDQLAYNATR